MEQTDVGMLHCHYLLLHVANFHTPLYVDRLYFPIPGMYSWICSRLFFHLLCVVMVRLVRIRIKVSVNMVRLVVGL